MCRRVVLFVAGLVLLACVGALMQAATAFLGRFLLYFLHVSTGPLLHVFVTRLRYEQKAHLQCLHCPCLRLLPPDLVARITHDPFAAITTSLPIPDANASGNDCHVDCYLRCVSRSLIPRRVLLEGAGRVGLSVTAPSPAVCHKDVALRLIIQSPVRGTRGTILLVRQCVVNGLCTIVHPPTLTYLFG